MVGDREADIYDLFMLAYIDQAHFLIRAAQNRVVQSNHTASETLLLETAIGKMPINGQLELEVCRTPGRAPRRVPLTVRFTTLELQPPRNRPRQDGLLLLPGQGILAQEECPPAGKGLFTG